MFFKLHSAFLIAATVSSLLSPSLSQDTSVATVKAAFDNANIPEDAYITFDPTVLLEASFPQPSAPAVPITAGESVARNLTALPPSFGIQCTGSAIPEGPFVVAMVDLDAPTPQNRSLAEVRHFLGGNFDLGHPNAHGLALLSNSSPAVTEFQQPSPPAGSDPHRYTFLLFRQSASFNGQTEVNSTTSTLSFNISQFAVDYDLGNPLGGTYMLVGPDASS
ncbi:hypothetical protein M0805_008578 [Coniferiporia weirii]|nr:hypothetical protein M0805_008578 [Coniferiporia weirii]